MATIKSFTSLEQSKKLAEILPIESADMYYEKGIGNNYRIDFGNYADISISKNLLHVDAIPCWSLAALLKCLSEINPQKYTFTLAVNDGKWGLCFIEYGSGGLGNEINDNPLDACYELILKLHELNLL